MGLETYHEKRDFKPTPKPKGNISKTNRHPFVVQEHLASIGDIFKPMLKDKRKLDSAIEKLKRLVKD